MFILHTLYTFVPATQVAYPSVEAAMAAAQTGAVWGVVSLLPSFSRDLLYRVVNVSTTQVRSAPRVSE
jgi:hypothetical protein